MVEQQKVARGQLKGGGGVTFPKQREPDFCLASTVDGALGKKEPGVSVLEYFLGFVG